MLRLLATDLDGTLLRTDGTVSERTRRAIDDARRLAGVPVDVVHIVGGGALNSLLCQLTADACELPVVAGPVEAAAYGNVLVQERAAGVVSGAPTDLRALLSAAETVTVALALPTQPFGLTAGEIEIVDVGDAKSEMNAADAGLALVQPPTFATTTYVAVELWRLSVHARFVVVQTVVVVAPIVRLSW